MEERREASQRIGKIDELPRIANIRCAHCMFELAERCHSFTFHLQQLSDRVLHRSRSSMSAKRAKQPASSKGDAAGGTEASSSSAATGAAAAHAEDLEVQ